MKTVNYIATTFLFVLMLALPLFAQTGTATPAKIGIINTEAFYYEKIGITRLINALVALNKEFEPRQKELDDMSTRLENLAKDIQNLQTQLANAANAKPPVVNVEKLQSDIAAKNDEGARLQIDIKRKEEDAKAAYEKRQTAVLGPIKREIGTAITEYSKTKGFSFVLDGAKAADQGILLTLDPTIDVTEDFVKFFNARPAATASATKPVTGTAAKP